MFEGVLNEVILEDVLPAIMLEGTLEDFILVEGTLLVEHIIKVEADYIDFAYG